MNEKLKYHGLGWVENIVGKEENAGNQHFLFFHNVFKSPLRVSMEAHFLRLAIIGKQDSQNLCYCVPWNALLLSWGTNSTIENS